MQPSTGKKGAGGPGARGGRGPGGPGVRAGGRGGGPGGRNGAFAGGRPAGGGGRPSPYDRPRIGERYGPPGAPPPRNGGGMSLYQLISNLKSKLSATQTCNYITACLLQVIMKILICTEEEVQPPLLVTLTDHLRMNVVVTSQRTGIAMAATATVVPCPHWEDHRTIEDLHRLIIPHPELVLITAGELHLLARWEIASKFLLYYI